ncbi:deoxynucleotidyltransferase terminal-interacting protein 1 [Exaiptasia diaphana]|uniref:DNTTIP1 dimerisation domain-containing protein n=1 Tax=Exaiptasia diaphana TaxID=2652724 RepID=A0A913XSN5_EXADI|nr:deoxynucleotidyltransferase terminal-interacting protein 1 [Exaiptasia diaphana]KXJ29438.1 Deoxynucleotidyltransferase terminal-interacting protein 1 [Exaiptasia diaphana]
MAEPPSAFQESEYEASYPKRFRYSRNYGTEIDREEQEEKAEVKKETTPNPFNMTARNFPKKRNHYIRSSMASYNRTRGSSVGGNKALELVRAALQPSLNSEIEQVLKSYQEMYKMAAANARENTGETISEEQINTVIRKSLDEAKLMYRVDLRGSVDKIKYERSERGSSPVIQKKRPRLDVDRVERSTAASRAADSKTIAAYDWDPESINEDTEFVMGVKANKALGFAATRGKLYYRHPHLFKYSGDSDDKQWLYEQSQLPITGGKAFLMICEEVRNLVQTHTEYRENENIKINDLKGFKVPKQMIEKMKAYMRKAKREAVRRRAEQNKTMPKLERVEPPPQKTEKVTETDASGKAKDATESTQEGKTEIQTAVS